MKTGWKSARSRRWVCLRQGPQCIVSYVIGEVVRRKEVFVLVPEEAKRIKILVRDLPEGAGALLGSEIRDCLDPSPLCKQNLKFPASAVPEIRGGPKFKSRWPPGEGVPFEERRCLWWVRRRRQKKKSGRSRPTLRCYHAHITTDITTGLNIACFAHRRAGAQHSRRRTEFVTIIVLLFLTGDIHFCCSVLLSCLMWLFCIFYALTVTLTLTLTKTLT